MANTNGSTKQLSPAGLAVFSALIQRSLLAGSLGQQFAGDRDLYDALGYPLVISLEQYLGKYARQDIAGRVVDLPAIDTWRYAPDLDDGGSEDTPLLTAWKELATAQPVWRRLSQIDRLAGIGRYGVLLLGLLDGQELDQPAKAGSLAGPADVLYLRSLSEKSASILEIDKDSQSERFGLPLVYSVTLGESLGSRPVHWSRVIHVAENTLEDDVYGTPRLERVYNRLEDLEKIVGGGSEATWKVMDRGLHADVRDGFTLSKDDADTLSDEIDEYMHNLRRFVRTSGVDLNQLGSDVVDPSGLFGIIISLIAAASNIPQRILIGSERGELASSQDQETWAGVIESRQQNFAEPVILRPFVDRLIWLGALPAASAERYGVTWRSLLSQDEQKQATIGKLKTDALVAYAGQPAAAQIVPPGELREKWLDLPADIPPEYEVPEPEPEPVPPQPAPTEEPAQPDEEMPEETPDEEAANV